MSRFLDWAADMPGWAVLALLAAYLFLCASMLPPETRCIGFEVETRNEIR
jgi:hypothetical protein